MDIPLTLKYQIDTVADWTFPHQQYYVPSLRGFTYVEYETSTVQVR